MGRKATRGAGRDRQMEQLTTPGLWKESHNRDDGDTWKTTAPERTSRKRPKAGKGGGEPLAGILNEDGVATPGS